MTLVLLISLSDYLVSLTVSLRWDVVRRSGPVMMTAGPGLTMEDNEKAFKHVLVDVLKQDEDTNLYKCLTAHGIYLITDLLTMPWDTIKALKF